MDRELKDMLERGISALESLAQDPVIEMETGPPVCPHCEKMNPEVKIREAEEVGPLAEFVIQAHCQSCNKSFIAIPVQWTTVKTTNEAVQFMEQKAGLNGFNEG